MADHKIRWIINITCLTRA